MNLLYLKHKVIGTPVHGAATRAVRLSEARARRRHPELMHVFLEGERTKVALRSLIAPDFHCVDVGAHIGSVLDVMMRLAPAGSHIAFEPVERKADWLRKKYPQVRIVRAAVSDEPGSATFHEDIDRPGFSGLRVSSETTSSRSYDVDTVRLDDVLADATRVDFMKIDVEGAELLALRGAANVIDRHRPTILFESGVDAVSEAFGHARTDVFDFFVERDYDVYAVVDFVFGAEPLTRDLFRRAAGYPFRSFNYFALPAGTPVTRLL